MIYECAPMEGVTGDLFRQAQARHFTHAARYYTPFLSATETRTLAAREMRELEPSHNAGLNVIPQLMGNDPGDFNWMAGAIRDLGYDEVNLNLGCPSGTVTAKKKGAGLLAERELLERMLDGVYGGSPLPVSIKMRLGCASAEEFPALIELMNRYPVRELIVHARVMTQQYAGQPDLEAFSWALEHSKAPVCYNGDVFDAPSAAALAERFPTLERVMLGRGLAANPGLIRELNTGEAPTAAELRAFHDTLWALTRERIPDKRAALFRMKEAWRYLGCAFEDPRKPLKAIRKATQHPDYERAVQLLFSACPVREHPGFSLL
ncbi:MAG: tRNA-dihydrouridine synthase family protein [Oscillospiraceae bacterium]|nr:tRNA-dihydrouridine synthase family protein [Oscillospiraceae bacterium]